MFYRRHKFLPPAYKQALLLARPLGLVGEVKYAMKKGYSPSEALEDWDIVLMSPNGTISPDSAECYQRVAGESVRDILSEIK